MSRALQKKLLQKLLYRKSGRAKLMVAWLSIFMGTVLLLSAVSLWWNFQYLLHHKKHGDSLGNAYLMLQKRITSAHMGDASLSYFSNAELEEIEKLTTVVSMAKVVQGRFPAWIRLQGKLDFSSDVFLTSVPDAFIDKKPDSWFWMQQSREVPLILPSEFIHLYNYGFALSRGLPQLSENSIKALHFDLIVGAPETQETYTAVVAGFSDRITAALVPQSFMDFANERYAPFSPEQISRVMVEVKDPSDAAFVDFMKAHDYTFNEEYLQWNKLRRVAEIVSAATGVLAFLLLGVSVLVLVLFIELTISRSRNALEMLLWNGYTPSFLQRFFLRQFLPFALSAHLAGTVIVMLLQYLAHQNAPSLSLELPEFIGWPVIIASILCLAYFSFSIYRAVIRSVKV